METANVNKTKLFLRALYYLVRLSRLSVMHTSTELCENSGVVTDVQMRTATSVKAAHGGVASLLKSV